MKLETFTYSAHEGWSVESLPALDSDNTLVVVFGSADFADGHEAFEHLAAAFPQSHIVGCSTAGEIFGTHLADSSLSVAAAQFEHGTSVASAAPSVSSPNDSVDAGQTVVRQLDKPSLR